MKKTFLSICLLMLNIFSSFTLLLLLSISYIYCYNMTASNGTKEVDGMEWGTGNKKIMATVKNLPHGNEDEQLLLTVYDASDNILFNRQLSINLDMFGAGFVKAMQADIDPEFEIVFYTSPNHHSGLSDHSLILADKTLPITFNFYLDINPKTGLVGVKNFDTEALPEARNTAEKLRGSLNPLNTIAFLIFCLPVLVVIKFFALYLKKCFFDDNS